MSKGKLEWGRILKKLSPYTIQKGYRYLKHYGLKEFWIRLHERFEPEEVPYGPWYEAYRPTEADLDKQRKRVWKYSPKISIVVPAYKTPEKFLREMMDSLREQTYSNWELCIANASPEDASMEFTLKEYSSFDSRIVWKKLDKNLGIAENTNAAFAMATGDYIGLLDHDDLLAPNALYEIASALEKDRDIDVIYTDEDKVRADLSEHFQPHLKPDFNPDLLRANNYICHLFVVRRGIMERTGGFRSEFDGAQDYDFIFRCVESAEKIHHIPEILYHWRTHQASTADNPASKMYAYEAGKRAIEGNLKRSGLNGKVIHTKDYGFYRVEYQVKESPLVSIIIPNKDEKEALKKCIDSIFEKSTYENFEILIVENNSETEEIFSYYRELSRQDRIRLLKWKKPFNYSAINNYAASKAKGEYLLFLNNDMEVISPNWMEDMLGHCQRPDTGIVGAKLYYPDGTIQHAGTIIGIGGIAGHMFVNMPGERTGYLHKASLQQDLSAVTAACMMVKREVFFEVNGFEEKLTVAFNDVDFCLRVRRKGYLVVYDPFAELYHYESKSRGTEDSKEKVRRFQSEIEFMRCRWETLLKEGDPYYNKNLSLTKWNYSLRPKE
ncbi:MULTISPECIES: glycosyltransferase family 2 protein [Blautia]|uniref:glycosyltransferase family 2 protein n=1 Tax=Blautia TaxID=572511 RepID=UPI001D096585|nr:glycosyltransferase family 2 protein [Blautia marasmi]MCB6195009.1 glycosyltransferase family 2 protein [Blautia marasmi]